MNSIEQSINKSLQGYSRYMQTTAEEIISSPKEYLPQGVTQVFEEVTGVASTKRIFIIGKQKKKLTVISIKTNSRGLFKDIAYLENDRVSLREEILYTTNY